MPRLKVSPGSLVNEVVGAVGRHSWARLALKIRGDVGQWGKSSALSAGRAALERGLIRKWQEVNI
jgi:hypothetical protein